MTIRAALPLPVIGIAAAFVWCVSIAFLVSPWPMANAVMKLALVGIAAAVTAATFCRSNRLGLLSPPYLLGLLVLIFYGLAPGLYLLAYPKLPAFFVGGGEVGQAATEAFVGSRGELFVLQFAAMCFTIAALVLHYAPVPRPPRPLGAGFRTIAAFWAPTLCLLLGLLYLLSRENDAVAAFFATAVGSQIDSAMAPMMSLCLATTAYAAAGARPQYVYGAVTIILLALTAMIAGDGLAFTPVRMSLAALLLIVSMRVTGVAALIRLAVVVAGIVIAAIVLSILSGPTPAAYGNRVFGLIESKLVSKLVHRQAVSGHCLDRIVKRFAGSEHSGPFYFLDAVVPRAIWPKKPNLSRGNEFARKYCGEGDVSPRQSESITLIGEPILSAGMSGLVVAELFTALLLGGAAFVGLSGGAVRLIALTAMLAWLVTFEQHFAQDVALVVKSFLTMLPFLALLAWAARAPVYRHASASA